MSSIFSTRGWASSTFFRFMNGSFLTREIFAVTVQEALTKVVETEKYAGHSFCISAAVSVSVEDSLIQTLGKWKSAAYLTSTARQGRTLAYFYDAKVRNCFNFSGILPIPRKSDPTTNMTLSLTLQ